MTTESLLVDAARGDRQAFSALYDALAPFVLGLATQILRDRAQAEEVTQEVFVELWRSAERFDPVKGSAKSWVLQLTRRRAIDRLRSDLASKRRDTAEFYQQTTTWLPAEDEAVESIESAHVRAMVDDIGEPHRTAIMLAYFAGLTHSEIADATGVALGTAKTRVRDGLAKLRARALEPKKGGTTR